MGGVLRSVIKLGATIFSATSASVRREHKLDSPNVQLELGRSEGTSEALAWNHRGWTENQKEMLGSVEPK